MRGHLPPFERNRSTVAQVAIYARSRAVDADLAVDASSASRRAEAEDASVAFAAGGTFAPLERRSERGLSARSLRLAPAQPGGPGRRPAPPPAG